MTSEASVARWRLVACLLLAAGLHAAIFAWVDFPSRPTPRPRPAIDLSLVTSTAAEAKTPNVAVVADYQADMATPAPIQPATAPARKVTPLAPAATSTPAPAARFAPDPVDRAVADLVRAVASEARRAGPKRMLRFVGTPTRPDFAFYFQAWRRKVERVGKINYPAEARRRKLVGSLRLVVTIAADGALLDARLLETSGHEVLDQAALRIVRLAAPYAPFPPAMREAADTLAIERTWQFRGTEGFF